MTLHFSLVLHRFYISNLLLFHGKRWKIKNTQKDNQTAYIELVTKLDTLSPLKTLARGYSLTEKDDKIVKSVNELKENDKVKLKFIDGEKDAKIC